MSEQVAHITDENFESEVLQSSLPVLADFWAEWCGPCRAIGPVIEEIAKEYASKLKVVKINVDQCAQTPVKYGVRGIPTLLLFKNGQVETTHVGALSKAQLVALLDENL